MTFPSLKIWRCHFFCVILQAKFESMERIFISYKRADKDLVFPIKDKIEAATGEKCWIDLEDINSDVNSWEDKIIHAINEASIFLFMYSTHVAEIKDEENDRTLDEFSFARSKNKRIVFINIDQTPLTDKYAFRFGQRQQIDATSEQTMNKLVEDIKIWLNCPHSRTVVHNKKNNLEDKDSLCTEGLEYTYYEGTREATICGIGSACSTHIIIPSTIQHNGCLYKVTCIEKLCFSFSNIESIYLPNSINKIGSSAFSHCEDLKSINIPEGVSIIRYATFEGCSSLESIKLPHTILSVEDYAFYLCDKLKMLMIPRGAILGYNAFKTNCKIIKY